MLLGTMQSTPKMGFVEIGATRKRCCVNQVPMRRGKFAVPMTSIEWPLAIVNCSVARGIGAGAYEGGKMETAAQESTRQRLGIPFTTASIEKQGTEARMRCVVRFRQETRWGARDTYWVLSCCALNLVQFTLICLNSQQF